MDLLRPYEEMSALAAAMAEAARGERWDELARLEARVAGLRDALASVPPPALDAAQRTRKANLIRLILDNDAEVRRHTAPWMEHVRAFLAAGARGRDLRRAYGPGLRG
ncbi:MAG: hypothetical protein AUK49_01925 [Betaproteobacteria bacterium CG2_30_68_42]|nr:MAG: hypothetical protein AUK49_01925 [Betaproteobacteria bacterium CG2_30_68_42]